MELSWHLSVPGDDDEAHNFTELVKSYEYFLATHMPIFPSPCCRKTPKG